MRASHFSYFWLSCLREAILDLSALLTHRALDAVMQDVDAHLKTIYDVPLGEPIQKTIFVDEMKCYNDYEPRAVREASLKDIAIAGVVPNEKNGFLHKFYNTTKTLLLRIYHILLFLIYIFFYFSVTRNLTELFLQTIKLNTFIFEVFYITLPCFRTIFVN
jgi:hypothetical protein